MRIAPFLTCVMLIGGCSATERLPAGDGRGAAAADACVPTPPIDSPAPESTDGGPAGPRVSSWYVNEDRSIWMLNQNWVPGERTKTAWFRPARTKLQVSGRRIDAEAPPLFVETSKTGEEYRHRFQPSIMIFPTEGCWEITAKAAQSEARFVVKVSGGSARADVD